MVELKTAYSTALADAKISYSDVALVGCLDIGDRYAFSFNSKGKPLIGAPVFTVNKNTGELGYLSIPPLENLRLLRKGTNIDIATFIN